MNYDLLNFRQEIDAGLDKNGTVRINLNELNSDLGKKSAAVLASIQDQVSGMGPDKGKLYLRHHQTALNLILEHLEEATKKSSQTENQKQDLLSIYKNNTEVLLSSLERYFPYYFDYSSGAHQSRLNIYQQKFKQKATECLLLFTKRSFQGRPSKHSVNCYQHKMSAVFFQLFDCH